MDTVDITPESLKTPEGAAKVAAAQNASEHETANVANLASQFIDLHGDTIAFALRKAGASTHEFRELRAAMRTREGLQNAFLRALAGR